MSNLNLSLIIFVLYTILAVYFWRAHLHGQTDDSSKGLLGHLTLVPLGLHGYLLTQDLFAGGGFNFGFLNAISMILWLTLLVYWFARFFYPVGALKMLVLPLAAVGACLPEVFPADHQLANTGLLAFRIHISMAMLAYSLFTIAVLHAVLISLVEKRLHSVAMPKIFQTFPPLLTMESLLFRMIGLGFVILTFTLVSGALFADEIFGRALQFNHKVLFGLISWAVFAVLLWGHHIYGWRGKIAVRWTVSGFVFLLLAYLGSKFVVEMLLQK